jgi:inhibitor of cysteine peptidase
MIVKTKIIISMRKIILTICVLTLWMCSCTKDNKNNYHKIAVGDTLQLQFESNSSTGYSWKWCNYKEVDIVDSVNFVYISSKPERIGGGGIETWTFKGIKSGIKTLHFEYSQVWDSTSTVEEKDIVVKVKK